MIERTMDMVSAQDIRDVKFSKTMGGYKAAEVDEFLDNCALTVEQLSATNEENNRKMQVLAETVVEYRNQEDSIRTALVSAQRMSETIINEANEQAAKIIAQAQEDAAVVLENANKNITAELEELQRVKHEVSAFKAKLMSIYREHLTLIGVLEGDETMEREDTPTVTEEDEPVATASAEDLEVRSEPKLDLSAYELPEEE